MDDPTIVSSPQSTRIRRLARELRHEGFRHSYMARQLKAFLAQQIKALRGDHSQKDFGALIGKPQSVVSRLEKQADRHISIQTLIDIAARLDIAIIIRFVNFPTFLRYTEDYSEAALAPERYRQDAVNQMVGEDKRIARESAVKAVFSVIPEQKLIDRRLSATNAGPQSQVGFGGDAKAALPPPANDPGTVSPEGIKNPSSPVLTGAPQSATAERDVA
jgi:hypothetical protein